MPHLFLELFSEEIPARMQEGAAASLARLIQDALAPLAPTGIRTFYGPRRIALVAELQPAVAAASTTERGPRTSAPPQALDGFLRKHGAARSDITEEGGYFVLNRQSPEIPAAALIAQALPALLRRFPWPKSMRWGQGSGFTWIRPLRRITCILDGAVVPFSLAEPGDDGHGLVSGNQSEGHRFHAPGAFTVSSAEGWEQELRSRFVIASAAERRRLIEAGITQAAASESLSVVPDEGLLDEVAGLVEWPVVLLGRIDDAFMHLPPEVMQVSMRVNQRYFALRQADGSAAPRFAFAANIAASDGGTAIIAGNERVLRARFSDARHFWDLDRRTRLAERVAALAGITFHAKLGTQAARVARMEHLARVLAPLTGADPDQAARAAHLAKADLTTGMVGEFPELQGIMGGYYAAHDGEAPAIAQAITEHYAPRGPADPAPSAPVAMAVALADKIDQLAAFFSVDEAPTGSGDPFALRRAALGVIRIIRENGLRIGLRSVFRQAGAGLEHPVPVDALLAFIAERLRVQLRSEGARHDVLSAVFAAGGDDDLVRLLARTEAVTGFLGSTEGADLLAGARRAANILRIEEKKDGHAYPGSAANSAAAADPAETALFAQAARTFPDVQQAVQAEDFARAMAELAQLRPYLDTFFEQVTVNDKDPAVRANRLSLLARIGDAMALAADFSRIEG